GGTNGAEPNAGLIFGSDHCLYGTTYRGGIGYGTSGNGFGTLFKVTTNGVLTTLKYFYGTTMAGGESNSIPVFACGTIFKMAPDGVVTTLKAFHGTDGARPVLPL